MTHHEAFAAAAARLRAVSESPELDARVLLGHAAGLSHASLLARWREALSPEAAARYDAAVTRRAAGEPVAWITGTKEFLGMDFEVGPGLLVPRPDTEILVEAALEVLGDGRRVLDVCTGTGCVAVGVVELCPHPLEAWACDVSPVAVATATRNAQRLVGGRVTVVASDLLAATPGPWDLIVSNPPYLTPAETRERVDGGWLEPALALDGGGEDGLDLIRRLVPQAVQALSPQGWLLLEASPPQFPALTQLLEGAGLADVRVWKDLAGLDRVIGGRLDLTTD